MWAIPTFIAATWWSWRTVSRHSTGASSRLVVWCLAGSIGTFVGLAVATFELTEATVSSPVWAVWGVCAGIVGVLLTIDVDVQLLPREVTLPAFVVTVVALSSIDGPASRWGPLVGSVVMTAVTVLLRWVSRRSLGMGDVLVSPFLGAVLGWFDPWSTLTAWIVAAVLGGVGAAIALVRGEPRQSLVAYGPFLFAGAVVALVGTAL